MKPAVFKRAFSPKVLAKIALLLFLLRLGAIPIQSAIALDNLSSATTHGIKLQLN